MNAVDIIAKKRDGHALSEDEIAFFVRGLTSGEIPDYQVSAWAMAVLLRGMTRQETKDLTMSMAASGEMLDLHDVAPIVVDKHSTGGVGDKTTIAVAPMVSACGLPVGKMSGRGLGFSGGTLDKLEAIPGYRVDLSIEAFKAQLREVGLVVAGQTSQLAPADGKLYALRDVTATVPALPLIASSIMSKKIAAGADAIVLDVKVGRGAFMKTLDQAAALASAMVEIGRDLGRRVTAVISDMNQPLGRAVGNALETAEAVATVRGKGPADFGAHCLAIGEQLLVLGERASGTDEARQMLVDAIQSGRAEAKLLQWIAAQGADVSVLGDPPTLARAPVIESVAAPRSGVIREIDAREVGLAAVMLGAGRAKKGQAIDAAVGIVLDAKVGDSVRAGESLFTVHARDRKRFEAARDRILGAYAWADGCVEALPLVYDVIS